MQNLRAIEMCVLVAWVIVITFLVFCLNGHLIGIDDADIFFVYAKNLAAGKGLLFSKGIPNVEGYTSTLWMLLSAGMFFLKFKEMGVLCASVLIFIGTHLLGFRIIEKHLPLMRSYLWKGLYLGIVTCSVGYSSWMTISLMDMSLWSFLISAMTYIALYGTGARKITVGLASTVFFLSPLARPEAFLFCPVILLIMSLKVSFRHDYKTGWKSLLSAFLVSATGLTFFRLAYFGYALPNTYYAKVSSSFLSNLKGGARYLLDYLSDCTLASLAIFVSLFWGGKFFCRFVFVNNRRILKSHDPLEADLGMISLVILMGLGIPVISGGDHFSFFRFYQPIYPLIALQWVLLGFRLQKKWNGSSGVIGIFVLIWVILFSTRDNWLYISRRGSPLTFEFVLSKKGRATGDQLNRIFSKARSGLPSIGVVAAGGIAMSYQGRVFDLMGLNNSFMAHFPGDRLGPKNHAAFQKAAFFQLPIDVLILPTSPDDEFLKAALKGLLDDPNFIENWTYASVRLRDNNTVGYEGFFRKQFVKKELDNPLFLWSIS